MKSHICKILVFGLVLSGPFMVQAEDEAVVYQVPSVMSAPVLLYDEGNNLLADGEYSIRVTLKDSLGTSHYAEEQVVAVDNGVANLAIGEGFALDSGLSTPAGGLSNDIFLTSGDVSVEIQVSGQASTQEVSILGSQPYAFVSEKALDVADNVITSSKIRNGSILEEDLDEALLERLESASSVVVQTEGDSTTIELNATNVEVSSDIGLNNASGTTVHQVLQELDGAIQTLRTVDLEQTASGLEETVTSVVSEAETNFNTNLNTHATTTTGVHGVVGSVVGTENIQTLTNKTLISPVIEGNVTISETNLIDGVDISAHAGASSSVHGVSGNVVGTSDTQTLSNKTLEGVSVTGTITMNGNNITGINKSDGSGSFDVAALEQRVNELETTPSFSESDISQSLKPFAYGRLFPSAPSYDSSLTECSGYNVDSSKGRLDVYNARGGRNMEYGCFFSTAPSNTNYVVMLTPSETSHVVATPPRPCWITDKQTQYFTVECDDSPEGNRVVVVDFLVFSNQ